MDNFTSAAALDRREEQPAFDASQFKLQPDGTFRISIRGMAAMAGVDFGGLARSLKSAVDENPLPCAKSLLLQGFCPEDVSAWGETGGIPEEAVPFILEHYSNAANHAGAEANGKARRARLILLSFARVGINAFLKDKLGLLEPSQVRDTPALAPAAPFIEAAKGLDLIYDMLEKRDLVDDRYRIEHKRDLKVLTSSIMLAATNTPPGASNVLSPAEKLPKFQGRSVDVDLPLTIVEFGSCYLTAAESSLINKHDSSLGRAVAPRYRERHGEEPGETNHLSTKAEQLRQSRGLPLLGFAKNGNAIKPKLYLPRDWDLIVQALREQGIIRPDRHAELLVECQQFRPQL